MESGAFLLASTKRDASPNVQRETLYATDSWGIKSVHTQVLAVSAKKIKRLNCMTRKIFDKLPA